MPEAAEDHAAEDHAADQEGPLEGSEAGYIYSIERHDPASDAMTRLL